MLDFIMKEAENCKGCIYRNPMSWTGCNKRPIFKRSKAGLNP